MHICNNCGARDLSAADLFIEQIPGEKRWLTKCKRCYNPASDGGWPETGRLDWLDEFTDSLPFEVFKTLNNLRVAHGHQPIKSTDNRRQYERHVVDLEVHFIKRKGKDQYKGKVKDLSKGGLCFITKVPLKVAEVISVNIVNPDPENLKFTFSSELEIVRSLVLPDGTLEIGGRFIGSNKKNMRKDKRYKMLLNVWYQRKGQEDASEGTVLDISRRGVAIIVPEQISVGEILAVCIRGESGPFAKQDLRGLVRVAHAECLYGGNYELGTEFIKTKVSIRDN